MHAGTCAAIAIALAAELSSAAHAGRGTGALRFVPDDAKLVVVADVARARKSPIFAKGYELVTDKEPQLAALKLDTCAETIVIASNGGSGNDKHEVVVLEGKVDKLVPEVKKRATETHVHAGITYWSTSLGEVAVLDKRMVVVTTGDMESVIDRAATKKRPSRGPAAIRGLFASTATGAAVTVIALLGEGDAAMRKDISKQLGAAPRSATLTFGIGGTITLDSRLQFADEASAAKAETALEGILSADLRDRVEGFVGKDFADSIAVDRDKAVARVSATMSADEADKVFAMARLLM
jgi:hypothetical protein